MYKEKYIRNEYVELWIENGILFGKYQSGVIADLKVAIKAFEDRGKLCEGKAYPVLADGRGAKYWSKEAREFMNSKKNCRLMKAVAVVISGHIITVISNFYMKVQKPIIPTRFFTSPEDGLKWLKQYKDCY